MLNYCLPYYIKVTAVPNHHHHLHQCVINSAEKMVLILVFSLVEQQHRQFRVSGPGVFLALCMRSIPEVKMVMLWRTIVLKMTVFIRKQYVVVLQHC
jgi:hypothetical protein